MKRTAVFLVALFAISAANSSADSWALPTKQRYCSANGKHCVEVDPKPIESQFRYFDDHVKKADNPGAGTGKPGSAIATTLVRNRREYTRGRSFPLLNEVAPVNALVSGDGRYIVTFDNWHAVGWGDNVIVIYRADGSVIKKYSLVDLLSQKKVDRLPRSVSSIWWAGEHRLDEARGELVLQVVDRAQGLFDDKAKYVELRIKLATGEKLRK
jgi:hypothetical protein